MFEGLSEEEIKVFMSVFQKVYDNAERMISKEKKPDLMETIFDACYLIFDLITGILFLYIREEIHCSYYMVY